MRYPGYKLGNCQIFNKYFKGASYSSQYLTFQFLVFKLYFNANIPWKYTITGFVNLGMIGKWDQIINHFLWGLSWAL